MHQRALIWQSSRFLGSRKIVKISRFFDNATRVPQTRFRVHFLPSSTSAMLAHLLVENFHAYVTPSTPILFVCSSKEKFSLDVSSTVFANQCFPTKYITGSVTSFPTVNKQAWTCVAAVRTSKWNRVQRMTSKSDLHTGFFHFLLEGLVEKCQKPAVNPIRNFHT